MIRPAPRLLQGGIDPANNFTKFPLFKAEIDPDITLFGFSLDEVTARGDRIETITWTQLRVKTRVGFLY